MVTSKGIESFDGFGGDNDDDDRADVNDEDVNNNGGDDDVDEGECGCCAGS